MGSITEQFNAIKGHAKNVYASAGLSLMFAGIAGNAALSDSYTTTAITGVMALGCFAGLVINSQKLNKAIAETEKHITQTTQPAPQEVRQP